jgi:hypothetical protein
MRLWTPVRRRGVRGAALADGPAPVERAGRIGGQLPPRRREWPRIKPNAHVRFRPMGPCPAPGGT